MLRSFAILLLAIVFIPGIACAEAWRQETNLYRRVERGMETAFLEMEQARKIYREGNPYKSQEHLETSIDTALAAYHEIVESGEDMRKRSRQFKKVEIQLRAIHRNLEDFEKQVEMVDRGPVERARQTISKMQDNLLNSMFQGGVLPSIEKVK